MGHAKRFLESVRKIPNPLVLGEPEKVEIFDRSCG
jgi:hypothetical protein